MSASLLVLILKCYLLIFQYGLIARPIYEPAAYQLKTIHVPAYNLYDAVQFSSSSKPVFNMHYQ